LIAKIGEGGMGEVWKALDTSLDREVAIKILPEAFAGNRERLARFEREARALAALNHPNIATIHGLHEGDDAHFIAMEMVPGETLRQRLDRGPVPLCQALELTRQIAQALEVAHNRGVIHRDLKPANINVTQDGVVKVLDFGLAKTLETHASGDGSDLSRSPTATSGGTQVGGIIGTAAYMSPEQARGLVVDRRADVWALGCVLFEMLTGRRVFEGETVSDTLAAVLRAEPDWNALPEATPRSVRRLLRRCLERDPDRRLHSAADARLEIDDAAAEDDRLPLVPEPSMGTRRLPWLIAAGLGIALVAAIAVLLPRARSRQSDQMHLSITLPHHLELNSPESGDRVAALSPDGALVAFTAREDDTTRLYLRSLGSPEIIVVPKSEGAGSPFFSPDGQWVAFFARGWLRKAAVQGGAPVDLCRAASDRGGTWLADGTIVFSPFYTAGLYRIPAEGGEMEAVTTPDPGRDERTHRWPGAFPGRPAIVFTIGTLEEPGYYEDATIAVLDLESGEMRRVIDGGSFARFTSDGDLLYSREGALLAVPFDFDGLEVTGPPTTVLEGVSRTPTSGAVDFSVAENGTIMYVPETAGSAPVSMVWVDREGRTATIMRTPKPFLGPRLSPDATRVTIGIGQGLGDGDIWVHDLQRGTSLRLTFEGDYTCPIWTADGRRVAFGVTAGGSEGVAWRAADGSDVQQMVFREHAEYVAQPQTWAGDSGTLIYSRMGGRGTMDLMQYVPGEPEPQPILDGPAREGAGGLSPDGRWMVYCSDESGQFEVYVRPYPGPGGRWQISTEGGKGPVWSRDGGEIFYTDGPRMMVVPVATDPVFSAETPRELFEIGFFRGTAPWQDYDVTPDGKRFLMFLPSPDDPPRRQINIVTHFTSDLSR
jgi:serine/threonine protein kinase/Tol biopolymer transport system component